MQEAMWDNPQYKAVDVWIFGIKTKRKRKCGPDDECLDYELTTDVSAYIVCYNENRCQHYRRRQSGCCYQSIVYLVIPHPTHGMWSEWKERPDHTPGTTSPTLILWEGVGGQRLNVTAQWHDHLTENKVFSTASMIWFVVRPGFKRATSRSADRRPINWANQASCIGAVPTARYLLVCKSTLYHI